MNKGQLRTHFLNLLNRTDCSNTLADTFLEQAISRAQRTLRIPSMEKTATFNISSSTSAITIPNDFLEIIDFYHGNTNISRVPLAKMVEIRSGSEQGIPKYFSRQDTEFLLYPYPASGSVIVNYYASFPALVADSDINDLTLVASDLVTYGALSYAADHFLDERKASFESGYQTFMAELSSQSNSADISGTVQSIQPSAQFDLD